jgi:hypothetical protein
MSIDHRRPYVSPDGQIGDRRGGFGARLSRCGRCQYQQRIVADLRRPGTMRARQLHFARRWLEDWRSAVWVGSTNDPKRGIAYR